ncbi:unnamed protein product [Closterium sp. NIES-64]|nr:unnamed protein product [Closterium sp. NIES-64]
MMRNVLSEISQILHPNGDLNFGVVLLELLTRQNAAAEGTDSHISNWAARKVQVYGLGKLKDAGLEAPDEAVVELADIALPQDARLAPPQHEGCCPPPAEPPLTLLQ